jgi:proline iminopeptidase
MMNEDVLFPPIEPYDSGYLAVDELHEIYWEVCGNAKGVPVVFLHGGPGAGSTRDHRRFYDPQFYRIILLDQRGAGRSKPLAELTNNSPTHLINDLEKLRNLLNIDRWLIFGGSWGSTLAIAYGEAYPERCLGFVLRGIFLMRPEEIEWFILGVRRFFPETWERFSNFIPEDERGNLLKAYYKYLHDPDPQVQMQTAKLFSRTEAEISSLLPNQKLVEAYQESIPAIGLARMETHFMLNYAEELGKSLLANVHKIAHLPAMIVQGRYDMCCPPVSAYELAKAWKNAEFIMIEDAGHSASEPGIRRRLVAATEKFKQILGK